MEPNALSVSLLSRKSPLWVNWLVPIGLLAAVLVAYGPALRGEFIWDDDYYVVNNAALRDQAGLQQLWLGIFPSPRAYPAPQYYPMTFTSLWIDYRLWGLKPLGYHVTSVLLHAAGCWTLFVILRRLAIPGAVVAAFVFALHPVHVESVAWVTERKNVLSGLFYLLSLLVYLRFSGLDGRLKPAALASERMPGEPATQKEYKLELPDEPWKLYALSLVLFVFGLLSKSVIATLPAAMLLVVFWKRRRLDFQRDVVPLTPFFVLGIAMSLFTSWMERNVVGAVGAEWSYTWAERTIIAGQAVWFYVGKLLLPINLAFIYDKWPIEPARVLVWLWPLSVVLTICVAIVARKKWGDGPGDGALLGLLFFGGTALPALGFFNYFPMRYAFVADHFVYLASLGLIVPLCAAGAYALRNHKPAAIVTAVCLCGVLGALAFRQARIYVGPEALWRDTIAKSPRAWMAHNNLGALLLNQGRIDEAEASFEKAILLHKNFADPVTNMGRVAEMRGKRVEAERLFQLAIEMNQQYVINDRRATGMDSQKLVRPAHAGPVVALARMKMEDGDVGAATALFERALQVAPKNVLALTGMGEALRQQGRREQALELQLQAQAIDPESIAVRVNLGSALAENNDPESALRLWLSVIRDQPANADAANNIGLLLTAMNQHDDAIKMFERALKARPGFALARRNLEATRRRKAAAATQSTTLPTTQTTQPAASPP